MTILSLGEDQLRTRKSLKWRTYPADVLPMWVAEMDVELQPPVKAALLDAIERSDTGYPHGRGYASAFAAMAAARWDLDLDEARQIRQAGDVMNGILAVLTVTTNPGDTVIINTPVYPPFRQVTLGYGRTLIEVPMGADGRLDLPAVLAAIQTRPAAYLLCSPHNPHGTVHTTAELTAITSACAEYGVQLVVDEIHACVVDPDVAFRSVLGLPGGERAIVVTSAGKAWNLAAFKAGLIIGGTAAGAALDAVPPIALSSMGHMGAIAHTAAMTHSQEWIDQLCAELVTNKAVLAEELATQLPQVSYRPGEGTYLAWVDCTALGLESPVTTFRTQGKVAFSPGEMFAADHHQWVRINLATSPDLIREGVRRMASALA